MIVWFPILKIIFSLVLLYLCSAPLRKHYYKYNRQMELYPLPHKASKYLPLAVAILVILVSPFRLEHTTSAERTINTFDPITQEPPVIETKPRQQYEAPSNTSEIQAITEGSKQ